MKHFPRYFPNVFLLSAVLYSRRHQRFIMFFFQIPLVESKILVNGHFPLLFVSVPHDRGVTLYREIRYRSIVLGINERHQLTRERASRKIDGAQSSCISRGLEYIGGYSSMTRDM